MNRARILRSVGLVSRPAVSVVIPCYNYERFLAAAVSSVLCQPGVDLEVIIVDDASVDGSLDVARGLAAENECVTVVSHPRNLGHIETYNDGLARAGGDYLVLLSADDLLTEGSLSRSVALLEANPSVGFVYGYSREFETVLPASRNSVRNWSLWPGHHWLRECFKQGKNFVYTPEVVMRAAAYRDVGGYDSSLPHSADFYLWMRTAARWDVGRVNGADQAYYRVHGSNMHLTSFAGVLTDLRERRKTFSSFLERDGVLVPDSENLRVLAEKALSKEALRLATACIDGEDPDFVAGNQLATECLDLCPAIRRTPRWAHYMRANRRATRGNRPGAEQRLARISRDIEDKIRWRRWRWSGQ